MQFYFVIIIIVVVVNKDAMVNSKKGQASKSKDGKSCFCSCVFMNRSFFMQTDMQCS